MVMLAKVIALLVGFVGTQPAADLVAQCKAIGMQQQHYEDVMGMDKTLPDFDSGYRFTFVTDDNVEATMEILEREKRVLQAGVQIVYPPATSENLVAKHYSEVQRVAKEHYGRATPVSAGGIEILNWADRTTVFYSHRLVVNGCKGITFRAGNRKFWD
jgi:hypothetical protein